MARRVHIKLIPHSSRLAAATDGAAPPILHADARVWGGIHWRTSVVVGRALGQEVGDVALARAFQYDDSDDDAPVRAISSRLEEHSRR